MFADLFRHVWHALPRPVRVAIPFGFVWATIALNVAYWPDAGFRGRLLLGVIDFVVPAVAMAVGGLMVLEVVAEGFGALVDAIL